MNHEIENIENSNLLSLIDDWVKTNGSKTAYRNVIQELLEGNSYLFIQTFNEVSGTTEFVSDKNTKVTLGIHEIEGKNYIGAFTDLELLATWVKVKSAYVKLPSKALLEMAEKMQVNGIVINTDSKNMFVVFISNRQ